MNLDEFIKEIDPNAGWHFEAVVLGPAIRSKTGLCPVCHLAVQKGYKLSSMSNMDYFEAGRAIGLNKRQTRDIVYASDSRMVRPLTRIRLLDATGLKDNV